MSTTRMHAVKLGLTLKAYGIELRLWKEAGEHEWGATLREDDSTVHYRFEEDTLTLAKFHLIAEARRRALSRSGCTESLPGCDTFLDSWKPMNLAKS